METDIVMLTPPYIDGRTNANTRAHRALTDSRKSFMCRSSELRIMREAMTAMASAACKKDQDES